MSEQKIIKVVYTFLDGAHIFSSNDPLAKGLYAASTDLEEAFNDVPTQAKMLLKLNHDIDDDVVHETPFEQFAHELLTALRAESARRAAGHERRRGVSLPSAAVALWVRQKEMVAA